jgi:catechol 2,3-dioxygenase-like lactoylglutathione lyase family enzyme
VFDHVTLRASDLTASATFYDTVFAPLGFEVTQRRADLVEWDDFSIVPADDERRATRGLHLGFSARSRAEVDEFWHAGTAAGYRDDGAPGERDYTPDYYGAFLLDPDGNSAEAVHFGDVRRDGHVDHLWIRVADVAASKRFYETIAPHAGLDLVTDKPDHITFRRGQGSFSMLPGTPTENVHMAFPADDDDTVRRFHAAATDAGYRDNGGPGERARYHPGYFGAFVLDPNGHNVEVVNHNR